MGVKLGSLEIEVEREGEEEEERERERGREGNQMDKVVSEEWDEEGGVDTCSGSERWNEVI